MTGNPLIAARANSPADPWAGVWIAEDIEQIHQGVAAGNWIDVTLGGVGAGLDGLAMVSDPVGTLLQYGVAWIIEHVRPLSRALDALAGDPGQIAAHAQTWRNTAATLADQATGLGRAVVNDVDEWSGLAAEAYRARAGRLQTAVGGLGSAAGTMATITEAAGVLVAGVRMMVRDAIAACVSKLIVYAAEEAASFGLATPLVVEQVTTTVAAWAARIGRWLRALLASLRRLEPIVRRLGELIEELKKILGRLRQGSGGSHEAPKRPKASRPGEPGFDPGKSHGPLGGGFAPGVEDPNGLFNPEERAVADRLAQEGKMVHPRERVDGVQGLTNPDAMVRSDASDPGRVTEFKTLIDPRADSGTIRRDILAAGKQVAQHGGGDVVVDGRQIGLTEEEARRGYARAVGQAGAYGSSLPDEVLIILGDGRIIALPGS